jgi:hypothetical protein
MKAIEGMKWEGENERERRRRKERRINKSNRKNIRGWVVIKAELK